MHVKSEIQGGTIAFLGPSLSMDEANSLWRITFLPPIERGQLLLAVRQWRPRTVLIVDGYFLDRRAVTHREIMDVLRMGILVFGTASMGALRACELQSEGMVGLGTVYEWYRSGKIDGDDEVAVIHHPDPPFAPLVIPCVNVRFAADEAVNAGIISTRTQSALSEAAKALYFADRTFERILEAASDLEANKRELADFLAFFESHEGELNLKKMDVRVALQRLRTRLAE